MLVFQGGASPGDPRPAVPARGGGRDHEEGALDADGVPGLPREGMYTAWERVLAADFHALVRQSDQGRAEVIDARGATDPAELFAVATEALFERPRALAAAHPALHELHCQQDPASVTVP